MVVKINDGFSGEGNALVTVGPALAAVDQEIPVCTLSLRLGLTRLLIVGDKKYRELKCNQAPCPFNNHNRSLRHAFIISKLGFTETGQTHAVHLQVVCIKT